jgi:AcrR family transcriptional regulator
MTIRYDDRYDDGRDADVDPTAQLSPTAQRLVSAARRLLARGGYEALTVEAVAAEAGAYRDSVRYYFGSKAAFIAAVVDSLAHDQSLNAYTETLSLPAGDQRVHSMVTSDRTLVGDRDGFRDFFALLPHVLLDDELRLRVAALYGWYRDLYVEGIDDAEAERDPERLRRLASLMVAMTDGLAVQKLLDPSGVDLEPLFALWEDILRREILGEHD